MGLLLEPGATLSVEEISDLRSVEADWQRLWKQLPEPSAFRSFPFIESAAATIPPGEIKILAVHSDQVVGIIPLCGDGTLRLIGNDAIILPGFEHLAMNAARDHLVAEGDRWEACDWQNVPADSALLLSDFGPGYSDVVEAAEACPVVALAGNDRSGAFKAFPSSAAVEPAAAVYRRVIRRL